jgi:hypothetical protein
MPFSRTSRLFTLLLLVVMLVTLAVSGNQAQAQDEEERCFEQTGFCISGTIRQYWEQNGGLPVFGYPKSEQQEEMIEGNPYQVQLFERNRLEVHPENDPPYHVLLGRLGAGPVEASIEAGTYTPPAQEEPREGCAYFEETGWNVCGRILNVYRSQGLETDGSPGFSIDDNKALFGLPLTPMVNMDIEGQTYAVQWFERARFELHPENDPPYDVLLGLLGNEMVAGDNQQPVMVPIPAGEMPTAVPDVTPTEEITPTEEPMEETPTAEMTPTEEMVPTAEMTTTTEPYPSPETEEPMSETEEPMSETEEPSGESSGGEVAAATIDGTYVGTFSTDAEGLSGTYDAELDLTTSNNSGSLNVSGVDQSFYTSIVTIESVSEDSINIAFSDVEGSPIQASLTRNGDTLSGSWSYVEGQSASGEINVSK